MTIYVDPLAFHGMEIKGKYIETSHLFTDGTEEDLIKFGVLIGLRRHWLQQRKLSKRLVAHFDLFEKQRKWAVEAGALEVTYEEAVRIWDGT